MNSSREGAEGADEGKEGIWCKVKCEEVRTGLELGGLESRGAMQSRPTGSLAGTSAWTGNS